MNNARQNFRDVTTSVHPLFSCTDPMVYITDYLSGGRYTSWCIKRE